MTNTISKDFENHALIFPSMTSGLVYHEAGRIRPTDFRPCDRETTVTFDVPETQVDEAVVYLLAHKHKPTAAPLQLLINGEACAIDDPSSSVARWFRCELRQTSSRIRQHSIQILPQPGWSIPFEPTSGHPVVRLRVSQTSQGSEPLLPSYGDPLIERHGHEWLTLLPEPLQTISLRWQWCWELAGFLSQAWRYRNEQDGVSYAPWDARVILPWARRGTDDNARPVIVMCVHYAVCFVQFCAAMGVPARAVVLTSDLNSPDGHFVAEVWLDEFQRWAMIDPNLHLCYREPKTGRPLSVAELGSYRLAQIAEFGEGFASQRRRFEAFVKHQCFTGKVYRLWGVWQRHDWAARPDVAPPAHGAVPYVETDILWCARDEATVSELGMFPHFLTPQQLAMAPASKTNTHATCVPS